MSARSARAACRWSSSCRRRCRRAAPRCPCPRSRSSPTRPPARHRTACRDRQPGPRDRTWRLSRGAPCGARGRAVLASSGARGGQRRADRDAVRYRRMRPSVPSQRTNSLPAPLTALPPAATEAVWHTSLRGHGATFGGPDFVEAAAESAVDVGLGLRLEVVESAETIRVWDESDASVPNVRATTRENGLWQPIGGTRSWRRLTIDGFHPSTICP